MTTKTTVATAEYGMRELRILYKKYVVTGLVVSASLHFAGIGAYYLAGYLGE